MNGESGAVAHLPEPPERAEGKPETGQTVYRVQPRPAITNLQQPARSSFFV